LHLEELQLMFAPVSDQEAMIASPPADAHRANPPTAVEPGLNYHSAEPEKTNAAMTKEIDELKASNTGLKDSNAAMTNQISGLTKVAELEVFKRDVMEFIHVAFSTTNGPKPFTLDWER
jgi:hypothetical protein